MRRIAFTFLFLLLNGVAFGSVVNTPNDIAKGVLPSYDVRQYGLKGDSRTITTAQIAATDSHLNSTSSVFVASDNGKAVTIIDGVSTGVDLKTTIIAYISPTSVAIADAPANTINGTTIPTTTTAIIGTDNQGLLGAMVSSLPNGGTVDFSNGMYYLNARYVFPANIKVKIEPTAGLYIPENTDITFSAAGVDFPLKPVLFGAGINHVHMANPFIHPEWYGALGDKSHDDTAAINAALATIRANPYQMITSVTLSATSGSAVITPSVPTWFSAADVGKTLLIPGAGAGGSDLVSAIHDVDLGTGAVTLYKKAGTSVSGKTGQFTGGGTLSLNPGAYYRTTDTLRAAGDFDNAIDILNRPIDNLTIEGNHAHILNDGGDTIPYTCTMNCTDNPNVFGTLIAQGNNVTIKDAHFDHTHVFHSLTPVGASGTDIRVTVDKNGIEGNVLWVGGVYGDAMTRPAQSQGASNIRVENCTFDGAWYAHIRPEYASNVHITDNTFANALCTSVFPGNPGDNYWFENNITTGGQDDVFFISTPTTAVHNVYVSHNIAINNLGRIGFGGVINGWITENYIEDTYAAAISVEIGVGYTTDGDHHLHINDNTIIDAGRNWGASGHYFSSPLTNPAIYCLTGDARGLISDVDLIENRIYNSQNAALDWSGTDHLKITGNTVDGGDAAGIIVGQVSPTPADKKNVENFTVQNNTIIHTAGTALFVNYSSFGLIGENILRRYGGAGGTSDYGIQCYFCDTVNIQPNAIVNDNGAEGFIDTSGSVNVARQTGNTYQGTATFNDANPTYPYSIFDNIKQTYGPLPGSGTGSAGTWNVGDRIWSLAPSSALRASSVATAAGTAGTLFAAYGTGVTTATMVTAKNTLAVGSTTGLSVGQVLLIGGETDFGKISAIAASATKAGTLASTGTAVTGTGTAFATALSVGDYITASGQTKQVSAIADDTHLTTATAFSPTLSGATFIKAAALTVTNVDGSAYSASATVSGAALSALVVGSITSSSSTLTVNDATNLRLGQWVRVAGAGTTGGNLDTRINAISGTTLTLSVAAGTTVTDAWVAYKGPTWDDGTAALGTTINYQGVGVDPIQTGKLVLSDSVNVFDQWADNSITGIATYRGTRDFGTGVYSGFAVAPSGGKSWPVIVRDGHAVAAFTGTETSSGLNSFNVFAPDAANLTASAFISFSATANSYSGTDMLAPNAGVMYNQGSSGPLNIGAADGTHGIGFYAGGQAVGNKVAQFTSSGLTLPGLTASTLLYANGSKVVSSATIGTGLSLSGGTLSNTGVVTESDPSSLHTSGGTMAGDIAVSGTHNLGSSGTPWSGIFGKSISLHEGTSDATMGIATLVGGVVTVNTTAVTINSRIFLTIQTASGIVGSVYVSPRSPGVSFDIHSTNTGDASVVAWMIVEPN